MRAAFVPLAVVAGLAAGCRASDGPAAKTPAANGLPASDAQPVASAAAARRTWTFDGDTVRKAPAGFTFGRTGVGRIGRWEVVEDPTATSSPNVLAQLDADTTDDRFPVAAADAPVLRDLRLSVRCKPVSGEVDQAVGLVFRYRDENNYYLTRANALESNVRLYFVKDGRRQQIATWNGTVIDKLTRQSLTLSQMQDIGGVRMVVPDRATQELLRRRAIDVWSDEVVEQTNYVETPRPDGYRAIHLIIRRHNHLVEFQLRTTWQQRWATFVEGQEDLRRLRLRDLAGDPQMNTDLRAISDAFASLDAGFPIPEDVRQAADAALDRLKGVS